MLGDFIKKRKRLSYGQADRRGEGGWEGGGIRPYWSDRKHFVKFIALHMTHFYPFGPFLPFFTTENHETWPYDICHDTKMTNTNTKSRK